MNIQTLMDCLRRTPEVLPRLLDEISTDDARWKPTDADWSILEIVRHLVDEETDDFRKRVQLTFADPDQEWPPIDPQGVAVERRYNDGELSPAIDTFLKVRHESLAWLDENAIELTARLTNTYQHPKIGPLRLGDVFAAWAAHDQLHLRQLVKRVYQLVQRDAGEFSIRYAGDW